MDFCHFVGILLRATHMKNIIYFKIHAVHNFGALIYMYVSICKYE